MQRALPAAEITLSSFLCTSPWAGDPLCCIFLKPVSPACPGTTFFQRCIWRRVPENDRVFGLTNLLPECSLCTQVVWLYLNALPLSHHWQVPLTP